MTRRMSRELPDPTDTRPQPAGMYLDLRRYEDWLMAQQQQICLFCRWGMILWAEGGPVSRDGAVWLICQRSFREGAKKNKGVNKHFDRRVYGEFMAMDDSCKEFRPTRPHSSRMQLLDMLGYGYETAEGNDKEENHG